MLLQVEMAVVVAAVKEVVAVDVKLRAIGGIFVMMEEDPVEEEVLQVVKAVKEVSAGLVVEVPLGSIGSIQMRGH